MGHTVASNPESGARWSEPDKYEVKNSAIVAQVEEEIMPCAFLVVVRAQREEIQSLDSVGNVQPPRNTWNSACGFDTNGAFCTYWGAMPNRSAVRRRDWTPKKKESLSRVWTTFADCQAFDKEVIRFVTCVDDEPRQ